MKLFDVWREPHPTVDLVEYPSLRRVEVADSEGPRDAAVEWAYALDLSAEAVVCVRKQVPGAEVTRWRVEPVTTYRARPA